MHLVQVPLVFESEAAV